MEDESKITEGADAVEGKVGGEQAMSPEHSEPKEAHSCLHRSGSSTKVIILAIDQSERAEQAFNWYFDTLHNPDHKVICIHSIEPPDVRQDLYNMQVDIYQQAIDHAARRVKGLEKKYEEKFKARNVAGAISLKVSTKPGETLVSAATEFNADLIVMGTRGLGRIRRTILGSVSDYVVHHAHCPVLICRH